MDVRGQYSDDAVDGRRAGRARPPAGARLQGPTKTGTLGEMKTRILMFLAAVALGGAVAAPVAAQVNPGTQNGFYDIVDGNGGALGTLVAISPTGGGGGWLAGADYWFWSGAQFPSSFRLQLHAYNQLPPLNAANASAALHGAAFDTSGKVSPAPGGNWWSIQRRSGGVLWPVGYFNIQPGGAQRWYSIAPNEWITIAANEALVFTATATAPTASMYRAACSLP